MLKYYLIKQRLITFRVNSDFKLLLIINGQQSARATFPCPYCYISLKDLKNREKVCETKLDDRDSAKEFSNLKKFYDLENDYKMFCLLGKNKNFSKSSHSITNDPLFKEMPGKYILEKCIIPELHVLQGFVNHLFWKGIVPLVGLEKALIWPKKFNLISKDYHGKVFEGNTCRSLLKKADSLLDYEIYKDVGKMRLIPFVTAFKAMDKVVHTCFATKRIDSDFYRNINDLKKAVLGTEVSITLKIHVLLEHTIQCLHLLDNADGLGLWSEQAGESIHREFLTFWNKRKINMIDNPLYVIKLKETVIEFSSKHI